LQQFRQQNRTLEIVLNERIAAQITDAGIENYPSLGDLYYLVFNDRIKDGGNLRQHMQVVVKEFNSVIQSVFQQYELVAEWDEVNGAPNIKIRKAPHAEFPIEGLSLGEQEVLALITSMYAARNRVDVFVIDEPEVHLNWHLEDKLFAFFDDLCERERKQAIIVTHSRAMFTPRYLPKTRFLFWEGGKVKWGPNLTPDQQRRIAGEAIEIIKLGNFSKPTFFVEDAAHTRLLEGLAHCFEVQISITQCGNSPNVKSLLRLSQREGGWRNTLFVVDGDNEGNPFPQFPNFIHLPVYCSDNFLLHPEQLAAAFGKSILEIQTLLRDAILVKRAQILKRNKFLDFLVDQLRILVKRDQILKRNKFLDFLVDQLRPQDLTYERIGLLDGSEIVETVATKLGTNCADLTDRMISYLKTSNQLHTVFPKALLDALRPSPDPA
jgi:hypothetical protein